ncbi:MAG: hypothetical protein R2875_12305 [Desulfobacterales bacterium]
MATLMVERIRKTDSGCSVLCQTARTESSMTDVDDLIDEVDGSG